MLNIIAVPAFQDNYIWLIQADNSPRVLIVDPGDERPVIDALERHQLTPAGLLITHHHHDHIGGIKPLVHHYNIAVYGPQIPSIPNITHGLSANDDVILDPSFPAFNIMDVGGHTAVHLAYMIAGNLFCGDTLFCGGCGRLLGGSAPQLFKSLQRISALPPETKIYCAHEYTGANLLFASTVEPHNSAIQQRIVATAELRRKRLPSVPSTLALELATNPFLRCHYPEVIASAETFSGKRLSTDLEVFTVLRTWKDSF